MKSSPTAPGSKQKRVRFMDQPAEEEGASDTPRSSPTPTRLRRDPLGYALWQVDDKGRPTEAKPHLTRNDDAAVLELGRKDKDFELRHLGLGKHITRVSREHLRIDKDAQLERYVLEDRSANGTYVNAVKVGKGARVPLAHNDIITILLDENDVPLLQYRFSLLFRDGEEEQQEKEPAAADIARAGTSVRGGSGGDSGSRKRVAADEISPRRRRQRSRQQELDDTQQATQWIGNVGAADPFSDALPAEQHVPHEWLRQNAVTLSAGLVLFGSALVANIFF